MSSPLDPRPDDRLVDEEPRRDRRLSAERGPHFLLDCEGQPITAYPGEPLAVALYAGGVDVLSRSPKFHRPRGAFCLSGGCNGCLMRVDGLPNVKACQVAARPGLRCQRQNAWPSAGLDMFAAADLFFAEGMDHHTLLTRPRVLNDLLHKAVRKLGGLGLLPEVEALPAPAEAAEILRPDVVIVGAGPAGLAAAAALGGRGLGVVVLEARERAGGSYLSDPRHGPVAADAAAAEVSLRGVELRCGAAAVGWYPEDAATPADPPGLLAAVQHGRILKIHARATLYACGSWDQNALFPDNDRPAVLAGRAAGLLLTTHRVLPGRRPLVVGAGAYAEALFAALREAGAEPVSIDGQREAIAALHAGLLGDALERATLRDAAGRERDVACDVVAVAAPPAPAVELLRQHGARVVFQAQAGGDYQGGAPLGFVAQGDDDGRVAPGVYAAGDVTGTAAVLAARDHGRRVGAALAARLLVGDEP